jgi:hypothetical protein
MNSVVYLGATDSIFSIRSTETLAHDKTERVNLPSGQASSPKTETVVLGIEGGVGNNEGSGSGMGNSASSSSCCSGGSGGGSSNNKSSNLQASPPTNIQPSSCKRNPSPRAKRAKEPVHIASERSSNPLPANCPTTGWVYTSKIGLTNVSSATSRKGKIELGDVVQYQDQPWTVCALRYWGGDQVKLAWTCGPVQDLADITDRMTNDSAVQNEQLQSPHFGSASAVTKTDTSCVPPALPSCHEQAQIQRKTCSVSTTASGSFPTNCPTSGWIYTSEMSTPSPAVSNSNTAKIGEGKIKLGDVVQYKDQLWTVCALRYWGGDQVKLLDLPL